MLFSRLGLALGRVLDHNLTDLHDRCHVSEVVDVSTDLLGSTAPNDDWYASTKSHSRWHMAAYAARSFPARIRQPLVDGVVLQGGAPILLLMSGRCFVAGSNRASNLLGDPGFLAGIDSATS